MRELVLNIEMYESWVKQARYNINLYKYSLSEFLFFTVLDLLTGSAEFTEQYSNIWKWLHEFE